MFYFLVRRGPEDLLGRPPVRVGSLQGDWVSCNTPNLISETDLVAAAWMYPLGRKKKGSIGTPPICMEPFDVNWGVLLPYSWEVPELRKLVG